MHRAQPPALVQSIWIVALILSLLFAQSIGLQHRIEHAGWQGDQGAGKFKGQRSTRSEIPLSTDSGNNKAKHSCSIFDASTLADTFDADSCNAVFANTANSRLHSVAGASWHAPVVHFFLSRAPPAAAV
jgi:hypothetical protein